MLGESKQKSIIENITKVEIKTGKLFVMSRPTSTDIIIDGVPLNRKTDSLLGDIPVGKHVLSLKKGANFVSQSFEISANQLTRVNLTIAAARDNSGRKGGQSGSKDGSQGGGGGSKGGSQGGGGGSKGGGGQGGGGRG